LRGHYIALEGIEGTGKSTIAARLATRLETVGIEVLRVREPGGTVTGERIRHVLLDPGGSVAPWTEALLFASARAQLAHELVGPALASGTWVVSDRSVYSSLAYQGGGRGLGVQEVRAVNEPGLGNVWPELVVLLRLDAETGLSRQHDPDRIGAEGVHFQSVVAATFRELAAGEPERFVVVDAAADLETVWHNVVERWATASPE
jgi:dTMP kinase